MSTHKPRAYNAPDASAIKTFRRTVRSFSRKHYRKMPWREDCSPYNVFISEIMLQQTQVDRVMEKFPPFIERFPGFAELADAPLSEVFALWQGLGYNRRAKWLRDAAIQIMNRYHGILPCDIDQLVSLPGIGKNTAGAIAAYAYNLPVVYIETNIRAVFIHHFFPNEESVPDADILPLTQAALDVKKVRTWYWALMDYGTWLKKENGNPSRRSGIYRTQKPFHGSDRKIRGSILKILSRKGVLTKDALCAAAGETMEKLDPLITSLAKEGLIREEMGLYRIGD